MKVLATKEDYEFVERCISCNTILSYGEEDITTYYMGWDPKNDTFIRVQVVKCPICGHEIMKNKRLWTGEIE